MSISKVGNGRRGRGGIPSVAPLVPQLLERIQSCATRGFLVGAKPKLVDDTFFFLSQFSRCPTLDGYDVPPAPMRHGAFRCFNDSRVFMQAAPEMPAISPGRFIVPSPYCR